MLTQPGLTDSIRAATAFRPEDPAVAVVRTKVPGRTARIPDHARRGTPDYATTYLWLDAGQSWPFSRSFEATSERVLFGWLFVVAAGCCWAMVMMMTDGTRPMEATLQMERLAEKLESTTAIPAATGNAVSRLLVQPWYDCGHVACSAQLADRNRAARARLEKVWASKDRSNEPDPHTSRQPRTAAAEVAR
jgi:hypothetical protein